MSQGMPSFLLTALVVLIGGIALGITLLAYARLRAADRGLRALQRGESRHLRVLMQNSPEGFWRVDREGVTLDVNRSMAELLGLKPDEMVGKSFRDYVPPESMEMAEGAFRRAVAGEPIQFEATVRRPDGMTVAVLVSTHPILDEAGRFLEGFGIVRDITTRHRIESERQHAFSLLEAALESTADGLLIVDRDGRIVRWNERFGRMWGIPEEILQSRDDDRALGFVISQLDDPALFLSKVKKLYDTPDAESFDTLRFRDGRVFERYSRSPSTPTAASSVTTTSRRAPRRSTASP